MVIDTIEHVCHEAIRAYRVATGGDVMPSWEDAPEEWRQDLGDQVFRTMEYPDREADDMFTPVGDFFEHGLMQAIVVELWVDPTPARDEQGEQLELKEDNTELTQ